MGNSTSVPGSGFSTANSTANAASGSSLRSSGNEPLRWVGLPHSRHDSRRTPGGQPAPFPLAGAIDFPHSTARLGEIGFRWTVYLGVTIFHRINVVAISWVLLAEKVGIAENNPREDGGIL